MSKYEQVVNSELRIQNREYSMCNQPEYLRGHSLIKMDMREIIMQIDFDEEINLFLNNFCCTCKMKFDVIQVVQNPLNSFDFCSNRSS